MKLTNLSILFFAICLCFMVIMEQKVKLTEGIRRRQVVYNNAIDNAAQDALLSAVELADGKNITLDKNRIMDTFYRSLLIGFMGNQEKKGMEELKRYVPVTAMIEEDGFYLYYGDLEEQQGESVRVDCYTDKIPYRYETKEYTYFFTLSDYISVVENKSGEVIEGDFHDLKNWYPDTILSDETEYEEIKRNCMISLLTEWITEYINRYNRIAAQYGIHYTFALPRIEKEEWYQIINRVSFLAFFQGYPYGSPSLGYYNRYALGVAKIEKGTYYYIQKDTTTGKLQYHRSNCEMLYDRTYPCISRMECIKEGAFRCEMCR